MHLRTDAPSTTCLLAGSVCALLGWSAWARGGTVVALQGPLPWLGLAILIFLAIERKAIRGQRSEVRGQRSEVRDQRSEGGSQRAEVGLPCVALAKQSNQNCSPSSSPLTSDLRPLTSASSPPPTSDLRPLTSDFFLFCSGLAFLALLTVQWWNAGRHPYFHPFDQRWVFTPAPHPGWPWAVDRNDAAEMLRWFFPAWALMLALRHARRPDWLAKRVAWFLVINAGLLAAFGIAQTLSGTHRIFWITPMSAHFFASFGYENHAASYFALIFALAAGMFLQRLNAGQRSEPRGQKSEVRTQRSEVRGQKSEVRSQRSEVRGRRAELFAIRFPTDFRLPTSDFRFLFPSDLRPLTSVSTAHRRTALATASICAVLCLAGMALSFSRAGLALAVGLSGVALFVAARLLWPRTTISQRVAVVSALIMGLATVFFVVASMGGNPLAKEAGGLYRTNLDREVDGRLFMVRSASQMWRDNPWFGVGGWGYRHFLPVYAVAEHRVIGPGDANAHNDAMQFLCEFGVVGFGFMLTATFAFAWPLLHQLRRHLTPGLALAGVGLLAVLFHSLIDLPFRSPGILYAGLAVAGVSRGRARHGDSAPIPSRPCNAQPH